jgi:hypothetical protein
MEPSSMMVRWVWHRTKVEQLTVEIRELSHALGNAESGVFARKDCAPLAKTILRVHACY